MRKPQKHQVESYDLRIEGCPWAEGLSREALYETIEAAFAQLPDIETEMLFLIRQDYGSHQEQFFCMPHLMWEALCETSDVMRSYLQICWGND
jgi:hypothetical protein